jgi:hypothetical protein
MSSSSMFTTMSSHAGMVATLESRDPKLRPIVVNSFGANLGPFDRGHPEPSPCITAGMLAFILDGCDKP